MFNRIWVKISRNTGIKPNDNNDNNNNKFRLYECIYLVTSLLG